MKKVLLSIGISVLITGGSTYSQEQADSTKFLVKKEKQEKLTIGGYGQIDYNQPLNDTARANGNLDVHRLVLFVGYQFNNTVSFVSEIEMEHHVELEVEQAYVNYKIAEPLNFRAGLMLVPMGIMNEYHEPPTFNGVERPNVDTKIIPTTWREVGFGFAGNLNSVSLKYQAYVMNGLLSYNEDGGLLEPNKGFKEGRQEAGENIISSPSISGKLDYYGIKGLKIGAAAYSGKTQSILYDGISKSNTKGALAIADSSAVGLTMFGLDARYQFKGLQLRAQLYQVNIAGAGEYNIFTGEELGSSMLGYYGEIGYDVLRILKKDAKEKLILFGRYEFYDTQYTLPKGIEKTGYYTRTDLTFGVTYKVSDGAAFKADYQLFKNKATSTVSKQINFGVGVWF